MSDIQLKLKAVADETRLNILKLLLKKSYCVKALSKLLDITESAVSQHLKTLREANLVMGEKRGYFVHYLVKEDELLEIAKFIENLIVTKKD